VIRAYLEKYIRVEGKSWNKIDEVDGWLQKLEFIWADDEAYANLQGEPYVATQFHVEESLVRICRKFPLTRYSNSITWLDSTLNGEPH